MGSFECDHTLCTGWTCSLTPAPAPKPIKAVKASGLVWVDPDNVLDREAVHNLWRTLVDGASWTTPDPQVEAQYGPREQ